LKSLSVSTVGFASQGGNFAVEAFLEEGVVGVGALLTNGEKFFDLETGLKVVGSGGRGGGWSG
jgi:hypothetical protein